jgi:hypothetical protein
MKYVGSEIVSVNKRSLYISTYKVQAVYSWNNGILAQD